MLCLAFLKQNPEYTASKEYSIIHEVNHIPISKRSNIVIPQKQDEPPKERGKKKADKQKSTNTFQNQNKPRKLKKSRYTKSMNTFQKNKTNPLRKTEHENCWYVIIDGEVSNLERRSDRCQGRANKHSRSWGWDRIRWGKSERSRSSSSGPWFYTTSSEVGIDSNWERE